MIAAHERPQTGPAAGLAARFQSLVPVILTERLRLRAPRIEDFQDYAEAVNGPRGRFFVEEPSRASAWFDFVNLVASWILRGHGVWTIETRDGGETQGFVLISAEPGDHEVELGFLLLPDAEGQGYATEAGAAARDHAFDALGLSTLVSTIDAENHRSTELATRLGGIRDAAAEAAHNNEILVYRYAAPETRQ